MTPEIRKANLIQRWKRLLPIVFFQGYLNLTVLIFIFGPWPWPVPNKVHLYGFLVCAHLALLLGYLSKCFSDPPEYTRKIDAVRLLKLSLAVNAIILIPTFLMASGGKADLGAALANPGDAYQAKLDMAERGDALLNYFRFALGPLIWPLFPLFILYGKRLNRIYKVISIVVIGAGLSIWILIGTNKGLFDFVILLTSFVFVKWIINDDPDLKRKTLGLTFGFILLFSVAGAFFLKSTTSRMHIDEAPRYFPVADMYADDNCLMSRYLPPEGQSFVRGFSFYLTLGYYGLSQSLEKDFQSCYGVGHSLFLQIIEPRLTGKDVISRRSLMDRLDRENGYGKLFYWHSIYTWIASDVGFIGTLGVIFLIGRLFALAWLDVLFGKNPFAVPVLASYIICLFYFSANNQAVAFAENFSAFYILHFFWLTSRKKPSMEAA